MKWRKSILVVGLFLLTLTLNLSAATKEVKYHAKLNPVIQEFKELINSDPIVKMYITQMIEEIPLKDKNIKNTEDLLIKLNKLLKIAPIFSTEELTICPLSKILVYSMCTPSGFAAYRNEKINTMIKKILHTWAEFLNSKESLYVLNDSPTGWKSVEAQKYLGMSDYQYNPEDKYWGFNSWNDFFTRKTAKGSRPISEPDNNKVIVSACDSTVYKISKNVQRQSKFWIKSQPYSLNDMLANDEFVEQFVGGSVYQAFLSPFNYHRWNSPISGIIKKAYIVEGLYFSEANSEGIDPSAQDKSQGYLAHVQTRAIIFIEADDPTIGLMCFMPVGMVEVSTCIIDPKIKPGYHVKKGEGIGSFQFGGSTNCLIFRPGVIKEFIPKVGQFYKMGEKIAIAN